MFINDSTKAKFYEYIYKFEKDISQGFGQYNINNNDLKEFLHNSDIFLGRLGTRNRKESKVHKQYILYDNKKPDLRKLKQIDNDGAHNLLRHIRNSMAHGNIDKKSKNSKYYVIKDFNTKNGISMEGIILIKDMIPLLNLLISSKN